MLTHENSSDKRFPKGSSRSQPSSMSNLFQIGSPFVSTVRIKTEEQVWIQTWSKMLEGCHLLKSAPMLQSCFLNPNYWRWCASLCLCLKGGGRACKQIRHRWCYGVFGSVVLRSIVDPVDPQKPWGSICVNTYIVYFDLFWMLSILGNLRICFFKVTFFLRKCAVKPTKPRICLTPF